MDERQRTDQVQNETDEIVDVEAVEVEALEPGDERTAVVEEHGTTEEAKVPPFLERDARAAKPADEVVIQADEVEPDTAKRTGQAEDVYISLFDDDAAPGYRQRWTDIQARFVDDPQASVRDADELVAKVIQHISDTFARQRSELESHWNAEGDAESSTEDLRLAVKRYHTFFDQLLNLKP
jgi:hypothetical protein